MSLPLQVSVTSSIDLKDFCAKVVHDRQVALAKVMWEAAIEATPAPGEGRWSSNLVNSWRLSRGVPEYQSSSIRKYLAQADVPVSDYPEYQVDPYINYEIGIEKISKYQPKQYSNVYLTNAAEDALSANYATDVNYGIGVYDGAAPRFMMERAIQAGKAL